MFYHAKVIIYTILSSQSAGVYQTGVEFSYFKLSQCLSAFHAGEAP